jgi:hypothetical protein
LATFETQKNAAFFSKERKEPSVLFKRTKKNAKSAAFFFQKNAENAAFFSKERKRTQ